MTVRLSVGFGGTPATLDHLLEASAKVTNVYTGGARDLMRGGRRQHVDRMDEVAALVAAAHERHVTVEVALNAKHLPHFDDESFWRRTAGYVRELESVGVDGVIVAHPFLMELVKSQTRLRLTASTICEITTPRSAHHYEALGVDVIVPSMNVNMRPDVLLDMKRALRRAHLRLMLNEHCIPDCPWRAFHYCHAAASDDCGAYHRRCRLTFLREPALVVANNVIRPEDVHRYLAVTDDFKVVGRSLPLERLVEVVRAYDQGRWDGNYLRLSDDESLARAIWVDNAALDGLWELKSRCRQDCEKCDTCRRFLKFARRAPPAPPPPASG